MSRDNDPGFQRGETFYQGSTIDTNNLQGASLEGVTKVFEDLDYSTFGAKLPRTSKPVVCRVFRNMAGVNLLPKNLVQAGTGPTNQFRIAGTGVTTAAPRLVAVDEFLPAAGVPNGDLFWGVIKGTAMLKTTVGALATLISAGDRLVGATGSAASTAAAATTNESGRVAEQVFAAPTDAASTAAFVAQLQNEVGVALSTRTTAETNADILVDVNLGWAA